MEEKKNNKKIYILITLGIIGALIITLGITYAYWRLTKEQTGVNVVNTDCFNIEFTGENDITLNKAYPLDDTELESFLASATPYHFTITNHCSSLASATINLESLNANADKQLADEWIDAILYETDYHVKLNKSKKLTGNPNNDANKVIADALHAYSLKSFTLQANEQKDYYLLLYMDQETPLSEDTQNATWKGKITLSAEYKVDQFANSGTLRTIAYEDRKGMWQYKEQLTKIVIETKKSKKEGSEGQTVYGPFDEGVDGSTDAIQSYVVCEAEDTNCIGYLQGDGGIKLNSYSGYLFYNFTNLTKIEGLENLDTNNVTNMIQMFQNCSQLQELDISTFDTSKVTTMSSMFDGMSNLTSLTLGDNFNTSSVINMSFMFSGMSSLQKLDISTFDTSSVENMDSMFRGMSNLTSLTLGDNFDTSSVTTMQYMFYDVNQLQELDLSTFDTSSVEKMDYMFYGMSNLTSLTFGDNFNTSSVTNMSSMFQNCSQLQELDLSNFDTRSVTNMQDMFYKVSSLKELNLNNFDTSSVTTMYRMFYGMSSLQELDLSSFNTSLVTTMYQMFYNDSKLTKITYGPNFIHNAEADTSSMFDGCQANKPDPSILPSWEGVSFD